MAELGQKAPADVVGLLHQPFPQGEIFPKSILFPEVLKIEQAASAI